MNAVKIPGFSADAALYETSGYYMYRASNLWRAHQTGVMPQMRNTGGYILCHSGGCSCNSEERCNRMFSEPGLCGDAAYCTESSCHCSF